MLSALRNFFITLLSALILLGLVGYLITDFALNAMESNYPSVQGPAGSNDDPLETHNFGQNSPAVQARDEGFTVLLIGHDYQPDVFDDYDRSDEENDTGFPLPERQVCADALVVVRVDQKTKTTLFCSIPTNAQIMDEGLETTLGELYGQHDVTYLAEKVFSLIGIPIDYYVSVGIPGLVTLIDEIGGISYHVPQKMEYYDEVEDYRISLKKGTQKLDGDKALQLLRFNGYGDNGEGRRETAVQFLKALISKITQDRDYYDNARAVYATMSKYVETNFSEDALARKLDLIFLYPEMTVRTEQYPGSVRTENDGETEKSWFELDTVNGRDLFLEYKYKG